MNLGDLIVRIQGDTSGLTASLKQASQSMQNVGKSMQSAGKSMSMYITAPLVAAGTAAFNLQKDFEASMSKINGLVGVSQEQVSKWSQEILKLAPSLGKAPKELADGLFFITSAGIKGAEAMDVLTASAKASAAGLGETATIADLVTSAMNAYGVENLSAASATDILVAAVREGKAEAASLAGAMGQVLPIASEMGVSFDQVGASVAAMTRTGTEANTAAMQLKNILASLLKPSQQAEEALNSMGISAGTLRKMIREDGLIATLSYLRKLTNQYGEDAMANVFPNIRALSGVLDLMGSNAEDNIGIFERMADSTDSLNKAFGAAANTTKFKMDQAIVSVKTSLTTFGQSLSTVIVPLIQKFSGWIQKLTSWFNSLSEEQKKSVIKWAAIAAAAGPVLIILGQVITAISIVGPLLISFITTIGTLLMSAVSALPALFSALMGPIGIIIAAIAALAAGVLYIWDNWAAVKERISDISWWKNTVLQMLQWIIEYSPFNLLLEGINAIITKFGGDPIPNPFQNIIDSIETLKDETKEYEHQFGSFSDAVKHGMDAVKNIFKGKEKIGGGGGAGSAIEPLVPTKPQLDLLKALPSTLQQVGEVFINTRKLVDESGMIERATPSLEDIEQMRLWTQELQFMSEGITNSVNGAMVDAGVGIGEMLGNFAAGAEGITSFGNLLKGIGSVVLEAVAGLAKQIGTMALESGVALLAIKLGLESLNPYVMIAAGVALIALSSAIRAGAKSMGGGIGKKGGANSGADKLQGLATGGTVTRAGAFMVGEKGPEMVSLPTGAAVTPNNMLGGGMNGQLVARVTGRDLEFVLDQWGTDKNRIS